MKRMIALRLHWLILLALWQPAAAVGGDIDCSIKNPYKGTLFAALYKSTEKTSKSACYALMASRIDPNTEFISALVAFGKESEQVLNNLNLNESADYKKQFSSLFKTFAAFDTKSPLMPEFKEQRSVEGKPEGFFEPLTEKADRFPIIEVPGCKSHSGGLSCREIFKEFGLAFNPYRSGYDNVYDNTQLLAELAGSWDTFLEASKSQTVLEVLLTTQLLGDHFKKDHLVGPPPYQVITLHPQLIYDTMSKAPAGRRDELGLALEWGGINFWDLKVPLGVSFATAYVNRAGVDDFGHGVMLHIMNNYAVGWAKHGGDNSFYFTIDLLKMLQGKKEQYDKYLKSYL